MDPNLLFGVDTKLFQDSLQDTSILGGELHHDEVQTVTVFRGSGTSLVTGHLCHDETCNDNHPLDATVHEGGEGVSVIKEGLLRDALGAVSKETVWRIKGFVRLESGVHILNWAFGRYELTPCGKDEEPAQGYAVRLTVMGERGEAKRSINRFSSITKTAKLRYSPTVGGAYDRQILCQPE